MKQRIFLACSLASAACLCLTLFFWVRSHRTIDLWTVGNHGNHHFAWASEDPALPSYPPPIPTGSSSWVLSGFGVLSIRQEHLVPGPRPHAPRGFSWGTHDAMFPSFGVVYAEPGDMLDRGWWVYREGSLCYWFIAVVFSVLPLIFLVRLLRGVAVPNKALQRTEAGGGAFSASHA